VDPSCYQDENGDPWDGELAGCINDARDMQAIAASNDFITTLFTDDQATTTEVIKTIGRIATELSAGDTFLLTYSGHGGQTPDVNGDDEDGQDETWCLFDRQLLDDELYNLWSQFEAGVRIFVLSDSCHSGTILKQMIYNHLPPMGPVVKEILSAVPVSKLRAPPTKAQAAALKAVESKAFRVLRDPKPPRYHNMPLGVQRATYQKNKAMYDAVQWAAGRSNRSVIGASVLLISGCQDNQLSADGDDNGLFTQTLLEIWKDGAFEGNYQNFADAIIEKMPGTQTPNYYKVGAANAGFESEKPFSLLQGSSEEPEPEPESEAPTITADAESFSRDGEAPSFTVSSGSQQYYVVEVASDYQLFANRPEDNTADFYATYYDEDAPDRETGNSWTLPESAWETMKDAEHLYYRIGTTPEESGWDPYILSTEDGVEPPSLEISGAGGGEAPEPEPESEAPTITADAESVSSDGDAPSFTVSTGSQEYYVVEVASDYQLFVNRPNENSSEFYATYYDQDAPDRETGSSWTLPESAWESLKEAERLYFRIGTTPGESGWDPYILSTEDGVEPPSLEVTASEERVPPKRGSKVPAKGTRSAVPPKARYGTKATTRSAPPKSQPASPWFGSSRSREDATASSRKKVTAS
jgi:hypothetical protein